METLKSGPHPTVLANVAGNRAVGMPFATRLWSLADQNQTEELIATCCSGTGFKGFEPCCHYRWNSWQFRMPAGWAEWAEWGSCVGPCNQGRKQVGSSKRSRLCHGLQGQCNKQYTGRDKTPWIMVKFVLFDQVSKADRLNLSSPRAVFLSAR